MHIPFLIVSILAAIWLPRPRALLVAAAAWAVCVAFVLWGPAHNSEVHPGSLGFWVPWTIVGAIGALLALGITQLRSWQRRRRAAA